MGTAFEGREGGDLDAEGGGRGVVGANEVRRSFCIHELALSKL